MNKKSIIIITTEIGILILLYWFINSNYIEWIPKCWVQETTGWLCPACGGTRFIIHFLRGHWIEAFFSHMVFFVGAIYLIIFNIIYVINQNRKQKIATWLYPKYWYVFIFVIALISYSIIRNLL